MLLRCLMLVLAVAVAITPADARKVRRKTKPPVNLNITRSVLDSDRAARQQAWAEARWGLAGRPLLAPADPNADGIKVRWQVNRVKLKVPFSLN